MTRSLAHLPRALGDSQRIAPSRTQRLGFTPTRKKAGAGDDLDDNDINGLFPWTYPKFLVTNGTDVNGEYEWGETPLHGAASQDMIAAGRVLLEYSADPNAANDDGDTPLHLAAGEASIRMVELLLDYGADINARGDQGYSPLQVAVEEMEGLDDVNPSIAVVKLLLDRNPPPDLDIRNENGETILHAACFVGNLQVVKALMDHGADPSATDHDGFTPLHTLMEGLGGSENTEEVLSFMLSKSANLHKKNLSGKTILHIACRKGETGWAEKILDQGADVNVRDDEGNSPLHLISDKNPAAMVELLLQHGADVGARNNATDTPLHSMYRRREADAAAKGVEVDAYTSERRTPLHLAAELGSLEMLKLLAVEGKADVAARDHEGRHAWRVLGSHDNSDNNNNDWYARGEARRCWRRAWIPMSGWTAWGRRCMTR